MNPLQGTDDRRFFQFIIAKGLCSFYKNHWHLLNLSNRTIKLFLTKGDDHVIIPQLLIYHQIFFLSNWLQALDIVWKINLF
jgi:hypothetical protein